MKIESKSTQASIEFKIHIELTEREARAWDEIVGYGPKAFLETFYEKLGKHSLNPYEKEVISMFKETKQTIGYQLNNIDQIKQAIKDVNILAENISEK